jgi:hypothetical protein
MGRGNKESGTFLRAMVSLEPTLSREGGQWGMAGTPGFQPLPGLKLV